MWSLALREEHTLRISEIRVQKIIFGLTKEEVTADWRKL
jgi:hypothetical protein